MTTDNFLTLSEAALEIANGNAGEVEMWLAVLIDAAESGQLAAMKSWADGRDIAPGGFLFQRAPAEWKVSRVALSKWISASGHGESPYGCGAQPGALGTPDPERRLAQLRSLGGDARYNRTRDEWTFTGMAALVASEKVSGRKRSDAKTIRADLKVAAQAEREAKAAGLFDGLGRR